MNGSAAASPAQPELRSALPFGWLDSLESLLARELTPTSRKVRTALRLAAIGTIGAGLVAACHTRGELGTYIVWLLVGAGPMMSPSKAIKILAAEALALVAAVVMARAFAETPWLMLPFLFAIFSFSTYVGTVKKLGAALILVQVVCLDTFYGVIFAPGEIGWDAAGAFGGTVIALGVIVLFDNWLWPDRGEEILMDSLAASIMRVRARFLAASQYYLDLESAPRPAVPPPTSDLPRHLSLLEQAAEEGVSAHRNAILLAAVTRMARISLEVDRLIVAVREDVPRNIRAILLSEVSASVAAIAAVLDEIAAELPTNIPVGVDAPPPPSRRRAREAMEALSARIIQERPAYIGKVSAAEVENFAAFTDSLATLTDLLDRLLDEPPLPGAMASSHKSLPRPSDAVIAA
ncbi:MAG TPA: hypothetical protein VMT58_09540, partial [Candidatus Binataceae bacterium]|nr:hypothetical protein [Candidatus Binataceae bacterium]